jgi:hypothetical protein
MEEAILLIFTAIIILLYLGRIQTLSPIQIIAFIPLSIFSSYMCFRFIHTLRKTKKLDLMLSELAAELGCQYKSKTLSSKEVAGFYRGRNIKLTMHLVDLWHYMISDTSIGKSTDFFDLSHIEIEASHKGKNQKKITINSYKHQVSTMERLLLNQRPAVSSLNSLGFYQNYYVGIQEFQSKKGLLADVKSIFMKPPLLVKNEAEEMDHAEDMSFLKPDIKHKISNAKMGSTVIEKQTIKNYIIDPPQDKEELLEKLKIIIDTAEQLEK